MRSSGRRWDEIRQVVITRDFLMHPMGSVLIQMGNTRVICTATLEEGVPGFLRDTGRGWLTAEYSMLPMATDTRNTRDSVRGRVGGRTHEIQRLIGRSLRAVTDLTAFGERTMYIDCDVIQADGGTRSAAITGSLVAAVDAFRVLKGKGVIEKVPMNDYVAAVSAGVVDGNVLLDLEYEEDSRAEVDMNFVMTGSGLFVEVQGTAEQEPFDRTLLNSITDVATQGVAKLVEKQIEIIGGLT